MTIREGPDFTHPFPRYLFMVIDVMNLLRGVFMFVIFVCKRSVWAMVVRMARSGQEVTRAARVAKRSTLSVKTIDTTVTVL